MDTFDDLETSQLMDYILDDKAISFDCLGNDNSKYSTHSEDEDQDHASCTNDIDCKRSVPFDQDFRVSLGSNYDLETNPRSSASKSCKSKLRKITSKRGQPRRPYCFTRPQLPDKLREALEVERRMKAQNCYPTSRREYRRMAGIINPTKVDNILKKKPTIKKRRARRINAIQFHAPSYIPTSTRHSLPPYLYPAAYPSRVNRGSRNSQLPVRGVVPNRPNRLIQQLHTTMLSSTPLHPIDNYNYKYSFGESSDLGADLDVLDSGQVCPMIKIFQPKVISNFTIVPVAERSEESTTKPLVDIEVVAQIVKRIEELQDSCTNSDVIRSKQSAFKDYKSSDMIINPTEETENLRNLALKYNTSTTSASDTCDSDSDQSSSCEDGIPEATATVPVITTESCTNSELEESEDEDTRVLNLLLEVAKDGATHIPTTESRAKYKSHDNSNLPGIPV